MSPTQDGCSFAVKDALGEHYPGRFRKQNPAAVELHALGHPRAALVGRVTARSDAPEPVALVG